MTHIDVSYSGPVFDGRAEAEVEAFIEAAVREIAREGEREVGLELIRVLKHPTGRFESTIGLNKITDKRWKVTDHGTVVYNHWLEGTGSRNAPVTRFRGYATFRRMCQVLDARASRIATSVLPPYLRRMNGV